MRTVLPAIVWLAISGVAEAQTAGKPKAAAPAEFFRAGGGFWCSIPAGHRPRGAGMEPCLALGPLSIGMARAEAEGVLGRPLARTEEARGIVFIYALAWSGQPRDSDLQTYAALRFDRADRVEMLQISGKPMQKRWAFSSLALGDPEGRLLAKLGRPFRTEPVAFNGAQLWSYGVWPFTFEVKDGRVISIRLRQPEPAGD